MKVPARCNRRCCQARRNLSKPPERYARWPVCHMPGCTGRMYVDKYRQRKGPHDVAPRCYDPCCPWTPERPERWREPIHSVSTPGCSGYEDWVLERSAIASPHSPRKPEDGPVPF